jgi:ABC-type spermidine/putrescine transport system permease subunit I
VADRGAAAGALGRRLAAGAGMLWLLPGLLAIAVLLLWPVGHLLVLSLQPGETGLGPYSAILSEPVYRRVLLNTGVSALGTTVICLLIGYPTAYAVHSLPWPWRGGVLAAVLFSYAVGTMPRAFSWIVLLGDRGLVNQGLMQAFALSEPLPLLYNQGGVLIGMTHVMLPLMVLTLLAAMARVPPGLVAAARTLGAGPLRAFLFVFLPMTAPGILAGMMITFISSLGFYVVPAVLGGAGQTTVVMILRDLTLGLGRWGIGAALSVAMILLCAAGAAAYVTLARIGEAERS